MSTLVEEEPELVEAVSTGKIWQLGVLHRQQKLVMQELTCYRVPTDLELLMRILVAVL